MTILVPSVCLLSDVSFITSSLAQQEGRDGNYGLSACPGQVLRFYLSKGGEMLVRPSVHEFCRRMRVPRLDLRHSVGQVNPLGTHQTSRFF